MRTINKKYIKTEKEIIHEKYKKRNGKYKPKKFVQKIVLRKQEK